VRRPLALAVGLLALFATPAAASEHRMIVNEVDVSQTGKQFVELIDPVDEPFPSPPYGLVVYSGAGIELDSQEIDPPGALALRDNTQPYLLAANAASSASTRDQELTVQLPTGAGQVCFYRTDPSNRINCLRYGTIASPKSAGTSNQGATPGTGKSLQVCGSTTGVATPTPKASNNCGGGGGGGGGGTTDDKRKPTAKLGGKKTQDVDKLAVTVTLDEDGTVSAAGTVRVPNSSKVYRFKKATKSARSGRKVKLRLKLSRKAKRAVKRALRSGRKLKAKITVTAVDKAKNKTTKRKTVRLKN
jgi:hypothetical protein